MTIYAEVNTYLRPTGYVWGMAEKRQPPGSKKGKPKPVKRRLDAEFPSRLKTAMVAKDMDVPTLSRKVPCTRAVLLKYLERGKSTTIEPHLLFDLADALAVSARWLLKADGPMTAVRALTPGQSRTLELHGKLAAKALQATWLDLGETLLKSEPSAQVSSDCSAQTPLISAIK